MSERKPLTLEKLRAMDGKPAYWADDKSYGIVSVNSAGTWTGIPFFRGRKNGVNFEFDIESRGMEVYEIVPHHLDRSAWEPCAWCAGKACANCSRAETPSCNTCKTCKEHNHWEPDSKFCPDCGRPRTDAAWEMLEKRLEGIA